MNAIQKQATQTKPQIVIKRVYPFEISELWNALTTRESLSEWLMDTQDFVLAEEAQFTFTTKPQGGFDGIIHCKIIDFEKPNHISYEWKSNQMKQPTIVTWRLKETKQKETLMTLSHNGFVGFGGWFTKQILRSGWKSILAKKLQKYLLK